MVKLNKWDRINYQPCRPIGDNNSLITGSERHIDLSRRLLKFILWLD